MQYLFSRSSFAAQSMPAPTLLLPSGDPSIVKSLLGEVPHSWKGLVPA
jgi:hypothetical protein